MRAVAIACACALLASSQPAQAKSVREEYAEAWSARDTRYKQSITESSEALKSAFSILIEKAKTNDPGLSQALANLIQRSQDMGYFAARSDQIGRAEQLLASKASVDRAQLWIQDQFDQAQQFSRNADVALAEAKALSAAVPTSDRLKAFGQAAFKRGQANGTLQELQTIQQNLAAYYQSKSEQDARRRARWAAALGAIGQSLRDNEAQNQALLNSLPTTRQTRCQTTGQMTNCTTF